MKSIKEFKPIETHYNGYRFRSRIEARWAVYFDAMDIEYDYEREGFDLGEFGWYLPDFWFPKYELWGEVKGDKFTDKEYMRASKLGNVLMLEGTPTYRTYYVANNGNWQADYLICNDNLCEPTDGYLHHTEYYGLMPDEMKKMVIEKYGEILKKGINAAKSARFEFGEYKGESEENILLRRILKELEELKKTNDK